MVLCAVFSRFAEAGIAVHGYDAHGHGLSEPSRKKDRAFVQRYSDLVRHLLIWTLHVSFHRHFDCKGTLIIQFPLACQVAKYGFLETVKMS